jgi:AraC family transcriptional regulator of adaptative response / methylphosphotriester-DNA alkyltransferase methyltransferase
MEGQQEIDGMRLQTHKVWQAADGAGSMPDEMWQAIVDNDLSFDGKFYYAVTTTGIFCRPSCKSRAPKKEHVRIFHDPQQALSENYRPCKRCKPNGKRLPNEEWVSQIEHFIQNNYAEALTLDMLADMCHGSPYHLQRTFKRIKGVTPAEFIQQTRIAKAMHFLSATDKTMIHIALAVGIRNPTHFVTLFKKRTGLTPTDYRQLNGTKSRHGGIEKWS